MDVIWQMLVGAVVAFVCGWAGAWVQRAVSHLRERFPEATDSQLINMRLHWAREAIDSSEHGYPMLAAIERRRLRKVDRALATRGITYNHRNGKVT